MKKINCFILNKGNEDTKLTVKELKESPLVSNIYLLTPFGEDLSISDCENIYINDLNSSNTVKAIAAKLDSDFSLIYLKESKLELGQFALDRFVQIAEDTNAGLVYTDYFEVKAGVRSISPVIDYQIGSLRDDFNFGPVLFYKTSALKLAASQMMHDFKFAGFYDLRLRVSQSVDLYRLPEYLYTIVETDLRKSGEKIFDYVDPRNRSLQIEMEEACTEHLRQIGAYLKPVFAPIEFSKESFEFEASVIIPVKNRCKTITDAIVSVLNQKANFKYNIIIIDNHSTDGTTEIIRGYAEKDERIVHLIPERQDLGIGGCWNVGVHHAKCGKFASQLDSDDLYKDETTLQKVVDAFYQEQCAMVVGSYQMTNFALEEIPPGIIDHREWTPENGRNNALRINGLGAPRVFYTPVLREIKIPNTSYGEDYAVGLAISRNYQIGRIYQPVYQCRRWDGNSDAALDIVKMNGHNLYKDRIRSVEVLARIRKNKN